MDITKLIALTLVFTACAPTKVALNPVCDIKLPEPFTQNLTSEVQTRLTRFEEKPIPTKMGVINFIYPCAVWDATLATAEIGKFTQAQTQLVASFMEKYGAISTNFENKNITQGKGLTTLIVMKTARAGLILVETDLKFAQNGETVRAEITISASKI